MSPTATTTTLDVAVNKLVPRDENLRDDANGDDLVASLRTYGVLQPLSVTAHPTKDGYFLVNAGHRRLDGAKKAGLKTVPVIVTELADGDVTAAMLIENMQRADLDVVEQAKGFAALVEYGWKQKDIADATGISPTVISRRIKLLALPDSLLAEVRNGELPLDKAELLVGLAEVGGHEEVEDFLNTTTWITPHAVANRIDTIKFDNAVAKLADKLAKAEVPFVEPDLCSGEYGLPKVHLVGDTPTPTVYRIVVDEVPVADPETGEVQTESDIRRVSTGPLDIETALAADDCDALTIKKVDGKAQLVAVRFETVEVPAPGTNGNGNGAAPATSVKEQRAKERAKAAHELEQNQAMVAGKLTKATVMDWALRAFVVNTHQDHRKEAARFLELEPVEKEGFDGKVTKRYDLAFTERFEQAEGAQLTRMVLALTLASIPWERELRDEIRAELGWVPFEG